jgi:ABC-type branched-subunit amino acid transport system ATPase component
MALLEVQSIVSGYGGMEILHGVSIKIEPGQIVSIIGPNGAGKSTLLKTVFGLLAPKAGHVFFDGREITGWSPDQIVRLGMCFVPQTENVFPSLTIQENFEMGAFIRTDDLRDRLALVFDLFPDLKTRRHVKVGALSGGQRQMVAMGRALMLDPKLLLLDEPSAGLAPKMVELIFEKIKEINRAGVAMVMVEQNAREALKFSDWGYLLASGENRFEDSGPALLQNEEIGRLYLGG